MEKYPMHVAMLGNMGVGKTKIVERFCRNTFTEFEGPTIGTEMGVKELFLPEVQAAVDLTIWDTSGQEQYRSICRHYYRRAQGIVLVYDTTNKSSFDALPEWLHEVKTNIPEAVLVLVGNKCDKLDDAQVDFEQAKTFANTFKAEHFWTSAKDGTNIHELFVSLCRSLHERKRNGSSISVRHRRIVIGPQPSRRAEAVC